MARVHEAGIDVVQPIGQALCGLVVLDQAIHHRFERNDAGGGEWTGLAHVAADHAAEAEGAFNELFASAENRSYWCGQSFRDAKTYRIGIPSNFAGRRAQRNCCVEDPCAVEVDLHVVVTRKLTHRLHVGERQHRAAGTVVRVFHPDKRSAHLVARSGPHRFAQGIEVHRAVSPRNAAVKQSRDGGDAAEFGVERVRAAFEQHFATALGVSEHGDEIRHGAAWHEGAGCFSGALGRQRFELLHGRITVARVVAESRLAHRFQHRLGGAGDGVASQINHG